ncbi:CHASE2 domain-containing protein [Caulobacter mirabilis]|uniref:CHASE2 domain-containing protein n=1 Tax=Caulobacter mirabilis TaxID=69666 RepID=UPI001558E7A0|nr:CHASE2 domain-containing protein [Caulobacter mirabilis]
MAFAHVILIAASLALLALDPYHLFTKFDGAARDLAANVWSVSYPRTNRPKVAVVTVGEDYLRNWDAAWPLPLRDHADLIEQMALARPKGIMIDFLFVDARHGPADIAAFTRRLAAVADATPVYLAVASGPDGEVVILPELRNLANTHPNIELVSVGAPREMAENGGYSVRGVVSPTVDRAAMTLLRRFYPDVARSVAERNISLIDIYWSAPPGDCTTKDADGLSVCSRISGGRLGRAVKLAFGFAPISAPGLGLPERYRLEGRPIASVSAADLPGQAPDRFAQLADAVVFYGGAFAFNAGDQEATPVYGMLPSVYAHAMALDNLVTLRGAAWRAEPPFGLEPKAYRMLEAFTLLLFSFLLASGLAWLNVVVRGEPVDSGRLAVADITANRIPMAGAIVLVALIEWFGLHISPGYWVGAWSATAAVGVGVGFMSRRLGRKTEGRATG